MPKEPTNLRQTGATKNSVTLEWNASMGATSYLIYSENKCVGTAKTNKITLKNIASSTEKLYNIYAVRQSSTFAATYSYAFIFAKTAPDKIGGVGLYWSNMNISGSSKYQYTIYWKDAKADGYQIEWRDQKGKLVKRTEAPEYYISNSLKLPKKLRYKAFKVRVRGFVNISNGNKIYGEWSGDKVIVPYAQITSTKLIKGSTNVKLTWKKISGAQTYTIYRATSFKGKYKKVGTTKNNTFIVKKNKKYKSYYVYVAANKVKVGKKRYNTTKASLFHDMTSYRITTKK